MNDDNSSKPVSAHPKFKELVDDLGIREQLDSEKGYGDIPEYKEFSYLDSSSTSQEMYNMHFISGVFAYYGLNTIPVHDDVHGCDFFLYSPDRKVYKVQLKSRITVSKKYLNDKDLLIAFPDKIRKKWFLVNHIQLIHIIDTAKSKDCLKGSKYVFDKGDWSSNRIDQELYEALKKYEIPLPYPYIIN